MSAHGLSPRHLAIINQVFGPYLGRIDMVGLNGSRAKGTHREYSDIDLVLYGGITEEDVDRIRTLFEESLLPFFVDVNAYHLIDYPPLRREIDSTMVPLFQGRRAGTTAQDTT